MSEYKSFEEIQENIDDDKNPVVNDVWNAAIEEAIAIALRYSGIETAEQIRKLRK